MLPIRKSAALAGSLIVALGAVAGAQQPVAPAPRADSPGKSIVMQGTIKFLEESDVAALREGVIKQMEFNIGDRIEADQPLGYLHDELTKLKVARQEVAANAQGAVARAEAQYNLSKNELAIRENLRKKDPRLVTDEEMRSYQARVLAAYADRQTAFEEKELAKAELALAQRELEEHIIRAPFTGYVTNRMKDPGEAVQANEPVLRLGRTDRLRFFGYLPLDSAVQVSIGDVVDVQPEIPDGQLEIEGQTFRGKITAIGREVSAVGRTEVQIQAEIANTGDDPNAPGIGKSLLAGLKGRMIIHSGGDGVAPAPGALSAAAANRPSR